MRNLSGNIRIKEIKFTGLNVEPRLIEFSSPVHVINGASNTGKSFLVESIDYMLGKESIDKINESLDYDEVSIKISLNNKPFTIYRGFPSANFEVYAGYLDTKNSEFFLSYYKTGKPTKKVSNINDFFWQELLLSTNKISRNLWGEKSKLTLRLLSRVIVSTEKNMISLDSPIVAGDSNENPTNRNVFKFLLTGFDDSNAKTIARSDMFKSENKGRVLALEEIVDGLSADLSFPEESVDSLKEREEKLKKTIDALEGELVESQKGLSEIVTRKKNVSKELMQLNERLNILVVNKRNFENLSTIYAADIERLQSQEEAAFLLTIGHDGECAVCGGQSQSVCDDLVKVDLLSKASVAEVEKIKQKDSELIKTIDSLDRQREELGCSVKSLTSSLQVLDDKYRVRAPVLKNNNNKISELKSERSFLRTDVLLKKRVAEFRKKIQESELSKAPKKHESKDFYPPEDAISNFCEIYADILQEIEFPGRHEVAFDYKRYDVVIDGNPRHLNGKGVRAILNSVYKIALLKHCREKDIFHPGLVILDSPLVTYRDPLNSKHGELNEDEQELAKSKISYRFLKYLHSIRELAQFIIIENIDVPCGLDDFVDVESFYGKGMGKDERYGLF